MSSDPEKLRILEQLVEGSGIGTWMWNVQTGETRFNARWADICGYTLDELAPVSIATWERLAHPDDLARSGALLQRHFDGLDPQYECEARMRHRDGHWVHVLDRGKVLEWDSDGRPLWMFGLHLDVSARREAEQARDEALDRLRRLAANVPGFLYQFRRRADGSPHFPFATAAIREVYGCTPEQVAETAAPVFAVLHPEDAPRVAEGIARSADELSHWHQRYRVNHPERGLRWVEGSATPTPGDDGSVTWHGYLRDVTDDELRQRRLLLAERVFLASQQGIMVTDPERRIVEVNPAFSELTGYAREEVLGLTPAVLRSGRHDEHFYASMFEALQCSGRWQGELWNRRKDGSLFAELLSISRIDDGDGQVQNYLAMFSDISPMKQQQEELDRIAHHDPLTGLPNRRLLADRLEIALAQARRSGRVLAVCYGDLDGFKAINDRFGHDAGDAFLQEMARRLRSVLRDHDTLARIGGDEFVMLLTELPDRE